MSLPQAQASNGVYDTDGDKLIEIGYLEQLAAIGYDPTATARPTKPAMPQPTPAPFP